MHKIEKSETSEKFITVILANLHIICQFVYPLREKKNALIKDQPSEFHDEIHQQYWNKCNSFVLELVQKESNEIPMDQCMMFIEKLVVPDYFGGETPEFYSWLEKTYGI